MDDSLKNIIGMFARYILIVLAGLGNLAIFYKVLTPLTIKAVYLILNIFSNPEVVANFIRTSSLTIEIVPACVAGSAFYLLFILVFSTADIAPKKRLLALLASLGALFVLNILRILILIPFANEPYFEALHWVFWHVVSTIFVVAVWLFIIYFFKIKTVPIYSDIKVLWRLAMPKKKKPTKNKSSKKKSVKKRNKAKRSNKN